MFKTKGSGAAVTEGRTLDHAAKLYDVINPLVTFGQEGHFSEKAIELLGLTGKEKVLDVGCGTGTLTIKIAEKLPQEGSSVVGLDAAPKMLDVARRKAGALRNVRFEAGVAENLPYDDGYFDCAISTFFFHHVNFRLKKKSLEEMSRVLKEGGKAVIVDVDTPTNLFGRICAYSGYWLFDQNEILENINGMLREAMDQSCFSRWGPISHHLGYITIFKLLK